MDMKQTTINQTVMQKLYRESRLLKVSVLPFGGRPMRHRLRMETIQTLKISVMQGSGASCENRGSGLRRDAGNRSAPDLSCANSDPDQRQEGRRPQCCHSILQRLLYCREHFIGSDRSGIRFHLFICRSGRDADAS